MSDRAQYVYRFGSGTIDGDGVQSMILGGKGAALAEMTKMGISVPAGFTISTEACRHWLQHGAHLEGLAGEISDALRWLEETCGKNFGDPADPLLVSIRSGAPISMPGMMDTVLNVGLNHQSVQGLARRSGSEAFALDSYHRLLQMFSSIVLNVPKGVLEAAQPQGPNGEPSHEELRRAVEMLSDAVLQYTGHPFPQSPVEQLQLAIEAVFRSWQSARAKVYRSLNGIPEDLGTAVTVQAMVFGNRGPESGTGVGFTRNPSTGDLGLFGEYLANAQGEDIVAGLRTPAPLQTLAQEMPAVYRELVELAARLELHYRDVQDFEFTVEDGRLYLLQTRAAKRSAHAAVKIAVDLAESGVISRTEAIRRVRPSYLLEIVSDQLDVPSDTGPLTSGLAASPGAAVGRIALSADGALSMHKAGEQVVLVTQTTTADDIHGMAVSAGLLTAHGGATSHAAVVARGMGTCCITGAKELDINPADASVRIGRKTFREGDWISLDGTSGLVFAGRLGLRAGRMHHPELERLLQWALDSPSCAVRANADTPADATAALLAGAQGIGLCRTEHMFFASDRLGHVRDMILAETQEERQHALEHLLPMQQRDFEELFRTMSPLPVTIRLLDPPLHEFLPSVRDIDAERAAAHKEEDWATSSKLEALARKVELLTETNPMMGHRGCRLSLTYPEILEMQVRAVLQAAVVVTKEGVHPAPEIMVPLVASEQEMRVLAEKIHATAAEVLANHSGTLDYRIGTMIELPRAAVCAGEIARHVSFVSFGTNDLTQMTFGFSRDDAGRYLSSYLEQGILKHDPFLTIDREGVGYLMKLAIDGVRRQDATIKVGVCGEHAGDPESIEFFRSLGVDYISCSPARLRTAQLAAAQAA